MAFNNVNNPRQMFPTQHQGNFSGMQATQPMGIFQQNQPYGMQQNQGFQQSFPSHHMQPLGGPQMGQTLGPQINPQMRPQMGPPLNLPMGPQIPSQGRPQMTPPMGLQIGAFPSNVQLGHQFPKQQQKIIDQQRKQAEEQLKKQQEMMKKKQLEAEKRKLQESFSAKKPSNANALNNLFGKNKTGASDSSMTDLIGSLGSKTSAKPSVSKLTSIFSRPGGSVAGQSNLTPGQWGLGYMPSGHVNSQGNPSSTGWQLHDTDDFGDFSQGPTPGQGTFNDFQSALEPSAQFGVTSGSFPVMGSNVSSGHPQGIGGVSVLRQTQAWHSTPSVTAPTSSTTPYNFPLTQNNISANSSVHAEQTTQPHLANATVPSALSWVGQSSVIQGSQMTQFSGDPTGTHTSGIMGMPSHGGQMTQFIDETTKNRAGSMSGLMSNAGGNAVTGGAMAQPGAPHIPGLKSQTLLAPTLGFQGVGVVSSPSQPVGAPEKEPNMQQLTEGGNLLEPAAEPVPEVDDSPERKLELLYGVTLPDWCVNGTDLPGVYKEITDKTVEGSDVIDTNRLFPILMASDLPRDQLGQIWNRANRAVPGQLNALELRIVLGLVALAQAGMKTERLTLEKLASCKAAPIPTIPESVLQTRGRGWSFTETSQATGNMEGSSSGGGHGSTSSDLSIDPSDRYSVFRTIDNPESTSLATSSSVDSKDDFGAFKSVDSPSMVKIGSQASEFSAFQDGAGPISSGLNRRETGTAGSSLPIQRQDFGNFQSVLSHKTDQSAFGDFQGQSSFNNQLDIPGPSNLEPNLGQDDFGDFQSEASSQDNMPLENQKSSETKMPDFSNFQKRLDPPGGTSFTLNVSDIAKTKPPEDEFADFQSGKESEAGSLTLASIQTPKEQQTQSLPGFSDLQFGGRPDNNKSSDVVGGGLFSESVSNNTNKSVFNVGTKGPAHFDGFGAFQHSPDPFSSNKTFTGFSSKAPEKLVSSLEKFKLSSHTLSPVTAGGLDSANLPGKQPTDTKQQDMLTGFASFGSDQPTLFADKTKVDEDKYSAFRDADFGSSGGVFSVEKPPPIPTPMSTTTTATNDQLADDGFADFGSFEVADQFTSGKDNDFGAFKSPENAQNVSYGVTSDSHSVHQHGFGVFQSSTSSNISSTKSQNINSADFGAFSSFAAGSSNVSSKQPNAAATVRDSLINSVSLEPTQRYKVLSHDSGDIDQHANAWSRCLNSCLLTLATATLAIQKITEQSVKEEVIESKEGTSYFSAIVEIYRVTLRIKASIIKSVPNNIKLQDIYREIERTWKDISGFLSGSDVLPSKSSLDFTLHHVPASEDGSVACGICLLNVNKTTPESSKHGDSKLMYGGRHYHSTCANFWCNRVDSVLPSLLPIDSLI